MADLQTLLNKFLQSLYMGTLYSAPLGGTTLGIPVVSGVGRALAQVGANANVLTVTVGASDGSFEVSGNILVVSTSGTTAFQVNLTYTDEGNTARTVRMNLQPHVAGAFTVSDTVANANGAVPYAMYAQPIRCKAATTIVMATSGTFTTVTYNIEAIVKQVA